MCIFYFQCRTRSEKCRPGLRRVWFQTLSWIHKTELNGRWIARYRSETASIIHAKVSQLNHGRKKTVSLRLQLGIFGVKMIFADVSEEPGVGKNVRVTEVWNVLKSSEFWSRMGRMLSTSARKSTSVLQHLLPVFRQYLFKQILCYTDMLTTEMLGKRYLWRKANKIKWQIQQLQVLLQSVSSSSWMWMTRL